MPILEVILFETLTHLLKLKNKKTNIFLSHWNKEKLLAEYLKDYLIKENKNLNCFCSSRDMGIGEWRKQIREKALETNIALLMLSPFSRADEWIQHESGIVYGSNSNNLIVPVLFGGAEIEDIPTTVSNYQALLLNNPTSFNVIIPKIISKTPFKSHSDFISEMENHIRRLCLYGHNSLMIQTANNEAREEITFEIDKQTKRYERKNKNGEIACFRLTMTPQKAQSMIHWKTGLKLFKGSERIFEIHAGCHQGDATWTIYHIPNENNFKYEIPVQLTIGKKCCIFLWFDEKRREIIIELVDSTGNHKIFLTDTNSNLWSLPKSDWDTIEVKGWCDNEYAEYAQIKYKTETIIEVDRN